MVRRGSAVRVRSARALLSQYVEPGYALELLQDSAEGVGYLLKDRVADVGEFAAAVRRVAGGGSALDPSVVAQLVGRRRRFLNYLQRKDLEGYRALIKELGLRR